MKDLRIVFMGTPDFATTTLKHLVEENYNIVGVITAPDRPAGRGQKLRASSVKEYAISQEIQILQPTNLKEPNFLQQLELLKADLQIVVAFRMLPKVVWAMPKHGTFNLHASLLPQYRGAAPINWAIINGETKTGNTTFFIDEKIDTGEIILQEELNIEANESAGKLHDRLMYSGAKLVAQTIDLIQSGSVKTTPQPNHEPKTAYKLNKDNTKINFNSTGNTIHNLIRGLNPYPTAWCFLKNGEQELSVKIYEASFEAKKVSQKIGSINIIDKKIEVFTVDGVLNLKKIQLPGKKAMDVSALLNGFRFKNDAEFF